MKKLDAVLFILIGVNIAVASLLLIENARLQDRVSTAREMLAQTRGICEMTSLALKELDEDDLER